MSNLSEKDDLTVLELEYCRPDEENKLTVLGTKFLENNEKKLEVIYKDKIFELKEFINYIDKNYNNKEEIKLILIIHNVSNYSEMFYECKFLKSITPITFINNNKNASEKTNKNSLNNSWDSKSEIFYMTIEDNKSSSNENSDDNDNLFDRYSNISNRAPTLKLPYLQESSDNSSLMLPNNHSLKSFQYTSKWTPSNIISMDRMFYGCKSLISLPDMSELDTKNVTNMSGVFCGC